MTTAELEAPTQMQTRAQRLFAHIEAEIAKAAEMGGDVQVLVDFKVSNGRLVGAACIDLKHRFDLQNG